MMYMLHTKAIRDIYFDKLNGIVNLNILLEENHYYAQKILTTMHMSRNTLLTFVPMSKISD